MPIDYTRGEINVVIDLIRQDNLNRPLSPGQVTFGSPSIFIPVTGVDRNTVVRATAIPGRGFRNSQTFYYNRVKLEDFVDGDLPDQLVYDIDGEATLSDLLPAINERYSINLTVDRIINKTLPEFVDGQADVILGVVPASMVYIGTITLHLLQAGYIPANTRLQQDGTVRLLQDGTVRRFNAA